jgi:hypothetical protein
MSSPHSPAVLLGSKHLDARIMKEGGDQFVLPTIFLDDPDGSTGLTDAQQKYLAEMTRQLGTELPRRRYLGTREKEKAFIESPYLPSDQSGKRNAGYQTATEPPQKRNRSSQELGKKPI